MNRDSLIASLSDAFGTREDREKKKRAENHKGKMRTGAAFHRHGIPDGGRRV